MSEDLTPVSQEEPEDLEELEESNLVDPIYKRYVSGVLRAIGSTEFYEYFMEAISHADNEFQFSNRKMEKTVDLSWVDAIENTLPAFQNIVSMPRNVIKEEELVVNVANARKAGAETVRHLAVHSDLIEGFNEDLGEVRPGRLMQRYREDSIGIYENRLVYTTLEYAFQFVKVRYDALLQSMSDEFGAKLKVNSNMDSATERVHFDMFLHIREVEGALEVDEKNSEVFDRISRIYRVLGMLMNTDFAAQLRTQPRAKGTVTKTNVLKRNKSYKQIVALWDFLRLYGDVGYTIKITEQNPEINDRFQEDIFHSILFNYLILKGYLEDEKSRVVPGKTKSRQRRIKPKFIQEIIEELTEDYDLPEVEVRKVLVEEMTRAQLLREEAEERRRLVEEQAARMREEEDRIKAEKEAERQERIRRIEAEKERIRLEKEAESQRKRQQFMERELEDRRRASLFREELKHFSSGLPEQLHERAELKAKEIEATQDFADAARIVEEADRLREEAIHRELMRRREEKERIEHEKQMAEELERLRAEQLLKEQLEAEARARREEAEREARAIAEAKEKDRREVEPVVVELTFFSEALARQLALRKTLAEQAAREKEERERLLRERRERKAAAK